MNVPRGLALFRHLFAIACFIACWYFLKRWYLFQQTSDHLLLWSFYLAGLIAVLFKQFSLLTSVSRIRLAIAATLVLLLLPWGEWLRIGTMISREEWTMQIFSQTIFLYSIAIAFHLFPFLSTLLSNAFSRIVEFFTARFSFVWLIPLTFFLFTSWIAIFVFVKTPLVQDSSAHLFQGAIFAQGKLFAPEPPLKDFFSMGGDMLVIHDGKWFGMYQPGFAALLAIAMLLNAEWFVSPLLGAATIAIWILYIRKYYGESTSLIFGILALFSPFLFLMSSTIMVYTPELFAASCVIYLSRRLTEENDTQLALLLSLSLMFGVLVRSFSLLPFLFPVLVYLLWNRIRAKSYKIPVFIVAGVVSGLALLFWFQAETSGDAFKPGYLLEYPDIGFGTGQHYGGYHSPLKSWENTSNSFLGLNRWATGWYSGMAVFVILFILFYKRIDTWEILLLFSCVCLAAFYSLFLIQDLIFGPRKFYPYAPLILMIAARTFVSKETLPIKLERTLPAVCLIGLITFLPFRLPEFVKKYQATQTRAGYLKKEIVNNHQTKRLVFLDKKVYDYINWNDPFLAKPTILLLDLGEKNETAIKTFPGYIPSYYRLEITYEKKKLDSNYKFFDQRSSKPSGYISLFELGMVIQSGHDYWTRDFFDIAYTDFLKLDHGKDQLEFVQALEKDKPDKLEYKNSFRLGLIHSARMLLLPKIAFEQKSFEWRSAFAINRFREEMRNAREAFVKAGDVGIVYREQLEKVEKRIDRNNNLRLEDPEVFDFLDRKLKIFLVGG